MQELYRRHVSARGILLPGLKMKVEMGLSSTFHEACLDLVAQLETLTILSASGEMTRAPHDEQCICTGNLLERLAGITTSGTGIGRAVREAVGGPTGCKRLEELSMAAVLALRQCGAGLLPNPYSDEEKKLATEMMGERMGPICRRITTFLKTDFEGYDVPEGHRHRTHETYRANWFTGVWLTDPQTLRVQSSLSDTYHYPWVELEVDLQSRRVTRAHGELSRSPRGPICSSTAELLQNLVGQTAWPGDSRAVRDAIGGSDGCSRFEEIVNEAYRAVFQAHYGLVLRQGDDPAGTRHALYSLLKDTCRPYTEFGADPQWNPQAAGDPASDVAD